MRSMMSESSEATETGGTTDLPPTRKAAMAANSRRYFTGKPCLHGHTAYRYTTTGYCSQCGHARLANGAHKARWKAANPKRSWAISSVGSAKARAARKGLEFSLTYRGVLGITPDICPVFYTPFRFTGNKKMGSESASLDRLDPSVGYVMSNVVVISLKANMIKNAYRAQDIARVAEWLKEQGYN